jgi:hypothetical protein
MSTQGRHRCRAALAAGVLLAGLSTAACASSASTSATGSTATKPGPVTSSSPTRPAVSPARATTSIAVTGSVAATVVSAEGPTTDGVFAGDSVPALLHVMQRAGHGFLSCGPRLCWQGRTLPAHSIGIAFQANPLGCEQVQSVRVSSPEPGMLRVDVQAHPVCTRGSGAAAKGTAILLAVPRSALPNTGRLTAEVDIAMRPGDTFVSLGTASTLL